MDLSKKQNKFYASVDVCPMWNWNKVYSDGKFQYLLKNEKDKATDKEFIEASDKLMDDFIKTFGTSKQYKKYLSLRFRIYNLKYDFIVTDNRQLANKIAVLESELDGLKKLLFSGNKNDFEKQLIHIEKWFGMPLDLKNTTVKKFYTIQEEYVRANKKRTDSRGRLI